jgi:hypothetical protein
MHGLIKKRGRSNGTKDRDPFSKDAIRQRRKRLLDLQMAEFEQKMRGFYAYLMIEYPTKVIELADFEALLSEALCKMRCEIVRHRKNRIQEARASLDPDLVKEFSEALYRMSLFSDEGEGYE